jgi:hypothetical protein
MPNWTITKYDPLKKQVSMISDEGHSTTVEIPDSHAQLDKQQEFIKKHQKSHTNVYNTSKRKLQNKNWLWLIVLAQTIYIIWSLRVK